MSEEKKETIAGFIKEIPVKLDAKDQVSLYNIIKKKCPDTIRILNEKYEGKKKLFIKRENRTKWYTSIINYLTKSGILEMNSEDSGTIHIVTDDYTKYFTYATSKIYSKENFSQHLMLYRQTAIEFLQKAGILDSSGNEIMQEKPLKKGKGIFSKYEKQIKWIMNVVLFLSIVNFILMVSKYGIKQITPFLSNTCLFTLSCIIICGNEKK